MWFSMIFTSSSTCLSTVKMMRLPRKTHMDTLHLNTYLRLIEAGASTFGRSTICEKMESSEKK